MPAIMKSFMVLLCSVAFAASAAAAPNIEFDKESHDYGRILYGDKIRSEFKFSNKGDGILKIEKLRASCGCTEKSIKGAKELASGDSSIVEAVFDTDGMKGGAKRKSIFVHSNDPNRPVVKLRLHAYVVRHLNLDPPLIADKLANFDKPLPFQMKISNTSDKPVVISGVNAGDDDVSASLKPEMITVQPGGTESFTVLLTKKSRGKKYFHSGSLVLETDYDRQKRIKVNYFLQVGDPTKLKGKTEGDKDAGGTPNPKKPK